MPWWWKSSDSKESKPESQRPNESAEASGKEPSISDKLPPKPKQLPPALQKIVDKADKDSTFFEDVSEG